MAERIASYEQQTGVVLSPDERAKAIEDDLQSTVTHEFGHILGIHHHLPNGAPLPPYSSDWKLTDNGGKV